MLKIFHDRLQHYAEQELQVVQAGFRKRRGTWNQIAYIWWIIEKQGNFRKTFISVSMTTVKPLTLWIMKNCGKLLERWEYQTILPVCWEIRVMVKKQQFELFMEKNLSVQDREKSKRGLTVVTLFDSYRVSTSSEMPGWMNYKPESRWGRDKHQ